MPAENFFDGWLSVPFMGSLFDEPQLSSGHSLAAASDPKSIRASNDVAAANSSACKRRGHTKSRLGCFSCKKRKIKCQETWPSCANCVKRGCTCRYPTVSNHMRHDPLVSAYHSIHPSDSPTTYSANDMRLFHHFLITAHPCTHYEFEAVWIRDIPAFSHQYDYLMHSMLALAGSHLSVFIDDPVCQTSLSHRQKAITGLEEAFSRWPPNGVEAHVMLATSYLLASQSVYLPDGFLDHVLSLRGCALLSQLILSNRLDGAFSVHPHLHKMGHELNLRNFPALDQLLVRYALHSLAGFSHRLDAGTDIERALFAQLVKTIRPLLVPIQHLEPPRPPSPVRTESNSKTTGGSASCTLSSFPSSSPPINKPLFHQDFAISHEEILSLNLGVIAELPANHRPEPVRSFNALMSSLLIPVTWPQDAVLHLLSPSNKLGNILMAHFCILRFILAPLCTPEYAMKVPAKSMVEWFEKIVDAVEDDKEVQWTKYMELPSRILRTMRCCLNQKRGLTLRDLYDILIKDPGVFREGRLRRLSNDGSG